MRINAFLTTIVFSFFSITSSNAVTYTCDEVDDIAKLGYNGTNVSITTSSKECRFSIGNAKIDTNDPPPDMTGYWQNYQQARATLSYGMGQGVKEFISSQFGRILLESMSAHSSIIPSDAFSSVEEAIGSSHGFKEISQDITCVQSPTPSKLSDNSVNFRNMQLSCAVLEGGSFDLGRVRVDTVGKLFLFRVSKGVFGDVQLDIFIPVERR